MLYKRTCNFSKHCHRPIRGKIVLNTNSSSIFRQHSASPFIPIIVCDAYVKIGLR